MFGVLVEKSFLRGGMVRSLGYFESSEFANVTTSKGRQPLVFYVGRIYWQYIPMPEQQLHNLPRNPRLGTEDSLLNGEICQSLAGSQN